MIVMQEGARVSSKRSAGMDVAEFKLDWGKFSGLFREGDSKHAVDNSSHPVGLVADWFASARRRRSYSLAARRSGGDPDYQPGNGTQGCLNISAADYADKRASDQR